MHKPSARKPVTPKAPVDILARFTDEAEALPPDSVEPFRGDLGVVRYNVALAIAGLDPHRDEVRRRCPTVDLDRLWQLPDLCNAASIAASEVPAEVSDHDVAAVVGELAPLRRMTLTFLEIAAELGLVPAGRVKAIRAGTGYVDLADDAVAIPRLFTACADALDGKHPFTAAHLSTLTTKGEWLRDNVTPKGAARRSPARGPEALLRDRLVHLIHERYEEARVVGTVLFGTRGVDAVVPPLYSKSRSAPEAKTEVDATAKTDAPPKVDDKPESKPESKPAPTA